MYRTEIDDFNVDKFLIPSRRNEGSVFIAQWFGVVPRDDVRKHDPFRFKHKFQNFQHLVVM